MRSGSCVQGARLSLDRASPSGASQGFDERDPTGDFGCLPQDNSRIRWDCKLRITRLRPPLLSHCNQNAI